MNNRRMRPQQTEGESRIFHATIEPDAEDGGIELSEVVADLEGRDSLELPTLYHQVDHLLEELFSDPPAPEAQVEISFTYEGYRIDVDQSGHVRLMPIG